jgi:hypothetical protein
MRACVFIGVNAHTCMSVCVRIVFLKNIFYYYSCLLFQISANLPFNIDPTGSCNLKLNFYIRVML